jgi:hypothetical protein
MPIFNLNVKSLTALLSLATIGLSAVPFAALWDGAYEVNRSDLPSFGTMLAVSEALWDRGASVRRLAVREIPRSGPPDVLLDRFGISARAIADAVKAFLA